MSQFDFLQPQREALQKQHSLLSQKLLELRRNAAVSADTSIQFQLKQEIKQVETELADLARRMDDLDRVSEDGRLYQALLKLGYRKQVTMFRKFVQHHPVAAFLIYGKFKHGQRWLLNRLVVL